MNKKSYDRLTDKLEDKLDEITRDGELTANSIEFINKVTDSIKNIAKIEMIKDFEYDDFETSQGREYRISRNRTSTPNMNSYHMDDMSMIDDDYSMARKRDRMGRYSRDEAKETLRYKAEEMLDMARGEKERKAIYNLMNALDDK